MKKQFITRVFLSSLVLALTSLFGGGNLLAQTVDTLTASKFAAKKDTYVSFTNVTASSSAVYAGQSAKNYDAIQLNASSPNGIVTTASGGKVTKVVLTWNTNTSSKGRTIDVYGKNAAYDSAADLYNSSTQGTKLGSMSYNGSATTTTLEITGEIDYEYIGIRSNKSALYLDAVEITWVASGDTRANPGISFSAPSCDVQIGNLPYKFPELNNPNSLTGIKYASSEPTIATIDANSGEITLTGEVGQTTISAEFSGNTEYKGDKVEYTLNVSKASAYIYKKVTATDDIMDGGQYIIVCEEQNLAKGPGKDTGSVEVNIVGGMIVPTESAALGVYTLEAVKAVEGGYALKIDDGYYLGSTSKTDFSIPTNPVAWTVTIDSDGNASIKCSDTPNRQILFSGTSCKNYASTNVGYNKVQLYQKVYPLTVSSATSGYATFYNEEEAYKMPEGLTGYAVTKAENGTYITRKTAYKAGATVPAKTPLLIIGQANSYYPAVVSGTGVEAYAGSNLLEGARDANGYTSYANDGSVYYYKLGLNAEKQLGFYWGAADGAAFQMKKATTAYLAIPQAMANGANALFFDFGPETGINEIQTEQADKAIFDLSGRRVQKATKGFYIVGGKKVLVK